MGELVQKPRSVEVLDARHPAGVRIGAQVAPIDELGQRIGDHPWIHRTVAGELLQHVFGAQVDNEPPLGGDEGQHHAPIEVGILRAQIRERLEPPRVRLRRFRCHRSPHGGTWVGRNVDAPSTDPLVPSTGASMFRRPMALEPPSIRIRTDELRTVREAMRDFGSLLTELEEGEVEKLVLTQRNRVRAVVVSVERWSQLEQALDGDGSQGRVERQS